MQSTTHIAKVPKAVLWQVGIGILTLIIYSAIISWKVALLVVYMILIHELGHITEAKKNGITSEGIYIVPFLGGMANFKQSPQTVWVDFKVSIMGPLWGLLSAIPIVIAYLFSNAQMLAAAAVVLCGFNLFNLVPVFPLDGGRIVSTFFWTGNIPQIIKLKRLSSLMGAVGILLLTENWFIFLFVAFIGWISSENTYNDLTPLTRIQKVGVIMSYVLLISVLLILGSAVVIASHGELAEAFVLLAKR